MAIYNKKEIVILLRLRQLEDYLEKKQAYFGKNSQDMKMLIIMKNTIHLLKTLDLDATDLRIDPDEFNDLKDEDLNLFGGRLVDSLLNKWRNNDNSNIKH